MNPIQIPHDFVVRLRQARAGKFLDEIADDEVHRATRVVPADREGALQQYREIEKFDAGIAAALKKEIEARRK